MIWDFASQAWRSKIKVHGRTWVRFPSAALRGALTPSPAQYLGVFRMEVEAAAAYDAASWFVLGAKAVVNFPDTHFDSVDVPRTPPQWLVDALLLGVRCVARVSARSRTRARAGGRRRTNATHRRRRAAARRR